MRDEAPALLYGAETQSQVVEDIWFAARRGEADMRPYEKRLDAITTGRTSASLDRLADKIKAYRARGLSSSKQALLDALSSEVEEERARVRGGGRE
ncbi:hypothetical protein [Dietzia natronolimnaea]|uniref:hypothetical protein n=1 Tax=Dietzia natronolimnaea TaxID=161920 RepID=UPI0015FE10A6|nr:hypothetical protein [Dietzia natronolimnaea]MBB1037382.1 hypothetical protein [Dietzia natronolimnaea]